MAEDQTRRAARQRTGEPGAGPPGRVDASLLLLSNLVEESLDQGYARAAARRAEGGQPARRSVLVVTAGLLAVGLLLSTAAAQARDRSSGAAAARAALVAEVQERADANERLERDLERIRSRTSKDRRSMLRLSAQGSDLARVLSALETVTGAGAVKGPGMLLRLDDAPVEQGGADTDPRTDDATEGRVNDRDLQTVVNEIWAAGAEAVAVNGRRLTALSAIRAAGEAILVDFRPLAPPYVVTAIGPPTLRTDFVSGFGGSYLQVLRDYGISYAVEDRAELRLPAAGVTLRHATAPEAVGSAPTTRSGTGKERG